MKPNEISTAFAKKHGLLDDYTCSECNFVHSIVSHVLDEDGPVIYLDKCDCHADWPNSTNPMVMRDEDFWTDL